MSVDLLYIYVGKTMMSKSLAGKLYVAVKLFREEDYQAGNINDKLNII